MMNPNVINSSDGRVIRKVECGVAWLNPRNNSKKNKHTSSNLKKNINTLG